LILRQHGELPGVLKGCLEGAAEFSIGDINGCILEIECQAKINNSSSGFIPFSNDAKAGHFQVIF